MRSGVIDNLFPCDIGVIVTASPHWQSILRKAYKATLEDPEFLAQAKKSKLIINYVSGEEIEKFVDEILAISPKTKKSLQFLIVKKKKKKP